MLTRFDPFREFDRLAAQAWRPAAPARLADLPIDAYRTADQLVVELDLPGVDPASVDVTVEKNTLTVSAERSARDIEGAEFVVRERPSGRVRRQLHLGDTLVADRVAASYEAGVLRLTVPVAEQVKARKVEITTGRADEAPAVEAA